MLARFRKDLSACYIALPTDRILAANHTTYAAVMRHEIGHCNGWPDDHKGARRMWVDQIKALPMSAGMQTVAGPTAAIPTDLVKRKEMVINAFKEAFPVPVNPRQLRHKRLGCPLVSNANSVVETRNTPPSPSGWPSSWPPPPPHRSACCRCPQPL